MKHFDQQAKEWDNDPKKTERAIIIAKEMTDFIQPNNTMNAFEFGCGTGLLSYQIKDSFKTITLADTTEGMIKVLQEKIANENIKNFKPLLADLLEDGFAVNENEYDVIYTLMTLHHILNIDKILAIFNAMLKTGGYLCIADLVQEDGSFHTNVPGFDGHNGFDREKLSAVLSNHGFKVAYNEISLEIEKEFDKKIRKYPLFLMICKKIN
ncbi:MAG: methyltransferase domain-containing protein [Lutibacter sp.]|nr:methyltransferase domain-containing protein [Lutibacter sp.]